jgi:hypothetical protein
MPRPTSKTSTYGIYSSHGMKHPLGHVFVIYADKAIWDETDGKFITPETLIRAI